ncbi:MAG: hypothetical protein DRI57_32265 [Deltaproteobacteria bacterium]|nr:MAG: hypothetical protein DRI57_32265 [Deltaproteobacteria bacterium]
MSKDKIWNGKFPMQPQHVDRYGIHRFRSNAVVAELIRHFRANGGDYNALASMFHDRAAHWQQFNQLHGYSVSGIPNMSREDYAVADKACESPEKSEAELRVEVLEEVLTDVKLHARKLAAALFAICEEDLK